MDGDTELEADEVERFFGHIVNSYKKRYEWMKIAVDCSLCPLDSAFPNTIDAPECSTWEHLLALSAQLHTSELQVMARCKVSLTCSLRYIV